MADKCFNCPSTDNLFGAPESLEMRDKWLDLFPEETPVIFDESFRICSEHFDSKYMLPSGDLAPKAIPTKFQVHNVWCEIDDEEPDDDEDLEGTSMEFVDEIMESNLNYQFETLASPPVSTSTLDSREKHLTNYDVHRTSLFTEPTESTSSNVATARNAPIAKPTEVIASPVATKSNASILKSPENTSPIAPTIKTVPIAKITESTSPIGTTIRTLSISKTINTISATTLAKTTSVATITSTLPTARKAATINLSSLVSATPKVAASRIVKTVNLPVTTAASKVLGSPAAITTNAMVTPVTLKTAASQVIKTVTLPVTTTASKDLESPTTITPNKVVATETPKVAVSRIIKTVNLPVTTTASKDLESRATITQNAMVTPGTPKTVASQIIKTVNPSVTTTASKDLESRAVITSNKVVATEAPKVAASRIIKTVNLPVTTAASKVLGSPAAITTNAMVTPGTTKTAASQVIKTVNPSVTTTASKDLESRAVITSNKVVATERPKVAASPIIKTVSPPVTTTTSKDLGSPAAITTNAMVTTGTPKTATSQIIKTVNAPVTTTASKDLESPATITPNVVVATEIPNVVATETPKVAASRIIKTVNPPVATVASMDLESPETITPDEVVATETAKVTAPPPIVKTVSPPVTTTTSKDLESSATITTNKEVAITTPKVAASPIIKTVTSPVTTSMAKKSPVAITPNPSRQLASGVIRISCPQTIFANAKRPAILNYNMLPPKSKQTILTGTLSTSQVHEAISSEGQRKRSRKQNFDPPKLTGIQIDSMLPKKVRRNQFKFLTKLETAKTATVTKSGRTVKRKANSEFVTDFRKSRKIKGSDTDSADEGTVVKKKRKQLPVILLRRMIFPTSGQLWNLSDLKRLNDSRLPKSHKHRRPVATAPKNLNLMNNLTFADIMEPKIDITVGDYEDLQPNNLSDLIDEIVHGTPTVAPAGPPPLIRYKPEPRATVSQTRTHMKRISNPPKSINMPSIKTDTTNNSQPVINVRPIEPIEVNENSQFRKILPKDQVIKPPRITNVIPKEPVNNPSPITEPVTTVKPKGSSILRLQVDALTGDLRQAISTENELIVKYNKLNERYKKLQGFLNQLTEKGLIMKRDDDK